MRLLMRVSRYSGDILRKFLLAGLWHKHLFILCFMTVSLACTSKKQDKPQYLSVPTNGVTITSFQGLADPSWLTDDVGALLTKSSTIDLGGYCSQGANVVVLTIDGVDVGVNPDCNVANRFWTYSGAFAGADGSHTVVAYGRGKDGTDYPAAQVSVTVVKDTVPSTITGFTAPATDPYTSYGSASVTISGNVSGGLWTMTASDLTGVFTLHNTAASGGAGSFDFVTTLNAGETRTITFTAYDKAGNASATMTRTVQYPGVFNSINAPLSMYREPTLDQASPLTSGTTVLSNSAITPIGDSNSYTSTNSAFVLETGLATSMTQ